MSKLQYVVGDIAWNQRNPSEMKSRNTIISTFCMSGGKCAIIDWNGPNKKCK